MKTHALTVLLLALALMACRSSAERAADYNDSIVDQQLHIINAFDVMDSTLNDTLVRTERLDYAHMNLQTTIKRGLLALDSIGSFRKDPSLELAAKTLFKAYDEVAGNEYRLLMDIKKLSPELITQAVSDSSMAIQQRVLDKSKQAQELFLKEQEAFGEKYHLQFE